MSGPLVAVVVNFNRRELLLRALGSLVAQTRRPDRTFVVDNGSTDESVAAVRKAYGDMVNMIALPSNLGSAGGFDVGLRAALSTEEASEVLLLDSDVELGRDCVARLAGFLATNSRAGVVGPKVYDLESDHLVQEFGGWVDWDTADLRRSHFRHDEAGLAVIARDQDVDYVPACCLLATRAACMAAGSFDPAWFLYWDDIDWCARVRAAGFGVHAVAAASTQHFSGRDHKRSLMPVYYGWRNRVAFFLRRTPVERRVVTWRALFTDCLRAQFTCEALALTRTAEVMRVAVEDALEGAMGRRDFSGVAIEVDAPVPVVDDNEVIEVGHVIGDATEELAMRHGAVLRDRFGKSMSAARAWALRQQFEVKLPGALEEALARANQAGFFGAAGGSNDAGP